MNPWIKRSLLAAGGVSALGAAYHGARQSNDMLSGKKTLYHGTTKENWEKIKDSGIYRRYSGKKGNSAIVDDKQYADRSKHNVFASSTPLFARQFTYTGANDSNSMVHKTLKKATFHPALLKGALVTSKNGKLIKLKTDYNKYKKMQYDPDSFPRQPKTRAGTFLAKEIAAKGPVHFTKKEIEAGNSWNPINKREAKRNPGRFAAGAALAGGSVAAGGLGASLLYKALRGI